MVYYQRPPEPELSPPLADAWARTDCIRARPRLSKPRADRDATVYYRIIYD